MKLPSSIHEIDTMIAELEKAARRRDMPKARLDALQKQLDLIDQQYYNDEKHDPEYHKLLEAQALILGIQNDDNTALSFIKEATISAGGADKLSSPLLRKYLEKHGDLPDTTTDEAVNFLEENTHKTRTAHSRISRGGYFFSLLAGSGVMIAGVILDIFLNIIMHRSDEAAILPFTVLAYIAVLVYYFILVSKRLHDLDHSAWWILTLFVPLLGLVIAFECLFIKGTDGTNKYGSRPRNSRVLYFDSLFSRR